MRHIVILGSTGSIGRSTLSVIRSLPGEFQVLGLSTNSDTATLSEQIAQFHPRFVCVKDADAALKIKASLDRQKIKLFVGPDGLGAMVEDKRVDLVVLAISGSDALSPLLGAIAARKNIALANKEALVMAGSIIMQEAQKKKVKILPIDSEQSAIWQCLDGQEHAKLKNIYLTASGGPFLSRSSVSFKNVSAAQVLRHPRWNMGKKVTVDSATLMNKGLEVLEAMALFKVGIEKIKVLIHPQAVIHSLVEFIDGVILAQLSITDMRIPIQYALTFPERLPNNLKKIDFFKLRQLCFQKPDLKKFPCLGLAYYAALRGGTLPAVLNAANEISVFEFLKGNICFSSIPKVVEKVLRKHINIAHPSLKDILGSDAWAREEAWRYIS